MEAIYLVNYLYYVQISLYDCLQHIPIFQSQFNFSLEGANWFEQLYISKLCVSPTEQGNQWRTPVQSNKPPIPILLLSLYISNNISSSSSSLRYSSMSNLDTQSFPAFVAHTFSLLAIGELWTRPGLQLPWLLTEWQLGSFKWLVSWIKHWLFINFLKCYQGEEKTKTKKRSNTLLILISIGMSQILENTTR